MPNTYVAKAMKQDRDQIFDLVNEAFKCEVGKSGIAYRKVNKYQMRDSARKHLEDMWVIKENRKVSMSSSNLSTKKKTQSPF